MAIVAYTGLPGSGKSYSVTEHVIIPAIKKGRHVYTNIPLNIQQISKDFPHAFIVGLDDEEIVKDVDFWDKIPPGAVIIIDECWKFWASGMRMSDVPVSQRDFFATHRHKVDEEGNSQQIILVTQDLAQVATVAKNLVEETFITRNLKHLGFPKNYRIDIYQGAQQGIKISDELRLRELAGSYRPEIYQYYKSATKSETDQVGNEIKIDDRGNIWKGWKMKSILAGMIILPVSSYFMFQSFAESYNQEPIKPTKVSMGITTKNVNQVKQEKPKVVMTKQAAEIIPQETMNLSDRWRVVGTIIQKRYPEKSIVIIKSGDLTRSIPLEDNCKITNVTTGYECLVDNEYITEYSGFIQDVQVPLPGKEKEKKKPKFKTASNENIEPANVTIIEATPRYDRNLYHNKPTPGEDTR